MQTSTITSQLPVASPLPQERVVREQTASSDQVVSQAGDGSVQVGPKNSSDAILKKIQALTEGGNHSVRFEMDNEINMLVVKVFDSKTDELVRQIPAESLLGTAKALQEFRRGLVVDDKT